MPESKPDPIREAIKKLLSEDATLKSLATGVFYELAPPEALLPYVIFENPSGTEGWCFQGEPTEEGDLSVKGIGEAADAEAIDRRCKELLNSEELSIDGFELLFIRSMSIINYPEVKDGERFQHVGHNYKLITEKDE